MFADELEEIENIERDMVLLGPRAEDNEDAVKVADAICPDCGYPKASLDCSCGDVTLEEE